MSTLRSRPATRPLLLVVFGLFALLAEPRLAAQDQDCDTDGLPDSVDHLSTAGTRFRSWFRAGNDVGSGEFPAPLADFYGDLAAQRDDLLDELGFLRPWTLDYPTVPFVYRASQETAVFAGTSWDECISMSTATVGDPAQPVEYRLNTVEHELFHNVQRRYLFNTPTIVERIINGGYGDPTSPSWLGVWMSEAQAVLVTDRLDAGSDRLHQAQFELWGELGLRVRNDIPGLPRTGGADQTLFDRDRSATLFWGYLCEQLGSDQSSPSQGIDFLLRFWDETRFEDDIDPASVLDSIAFAEARGSLESLFFDYAIACYLQDLDIASILATVATPERYFFSDALEGSVDENGVPQVTTGSKLLPVTRLSLCVDGGTCVDLDGEAPAPENVSLPFTRIFALPNSPAQPENGVRQMAARYLDFDLSNLAGTCEPLVLRARSCAEVGWAVVSVGPLGDVVELAKGRGDSFSHALLQDEAAAVERLALIVVGLRDDAGFEVWLDRVVPGAGDLELLHPTAESPVLAGPSTAPQPFLVRVRLSGFPTVPVSTICPSAGGDPAETTFAGPGLRAEQFEAYLFPVEGVPAVLRASASWYAGSGEYWLRFTPGADEIPFDGAYRLLVRLACGSSFDFSAEEREAVIFGPRIVNHALVLDASNSMRFEAGAGTRLDVLQSAARFYVDLVGVSDRVGVVTFSGDEDDCTDNSALPVPVAAASVATRNAARQAIDSIDPSGWTSIGDGVARAKDDLGRFFTAADIGAMVVLSDGEPNEGRYLKEAVTVGCDRPAVLPGLELSDIVVNTVGFGSEAEQGLMQELAERCRGLYSFVDVGQGGGASLTTALSLRNRLADAFLRSLEHARELDRLVARRFRFSGDRDVEIQIELRGLVEVPRDGVFFFHVDEDDAGLLVDLFDPDGAPASAVVFGDGTHRVFHLPEGAPFAPGRWTARVRVSRDCELFAGVLGRDPRAVFADIDVGQARTGGIQGSVERYEVEQAVPVAILVALHDRQGPVIGADVRALVEKPDGTVAGQSCGGYRLHDDGAHGDGIAGDGVYGLLFTETAQASEGGARNDDRGLEGPVGGERGSYLVAVTAVGSNNSGLEFRRDLEAHFHVRESDKDRDNDGLEDFWEMWYRTDPDVDDADADYDDDGASNTEERELGTDPWNPDTDGNGEADGSELRQGRCATIPEDDLFEFPRNVSLITDGHDGGGPQPLADAVVIRFPFHSTWEALEIQRSVDGGGFSQRAVIEGDELLALSWADTEVESGRRYGYRLRAFGDGGARSRFSRTLETVVWSDPRPVVGWVTIDNGFRITDGRDVRLRVEASSNATAYRISTSPFTGGETIERIPDRPFSFELPPVPRYPAEQSVYVQMFDVEGKPSDVFRASILVDPERDADGDRLRNDADSDDDADGILDVDEVVRYRTDPFDRDTDDDGVADAAELGVSNPLARDSDQDGLDDGEERSAGSDPLDPDTDGDGLWDGEDPDPTASDAAPFLRGDANQSGTHDVSDVITILLTLFVRPLDRSCPDSLDANDDGRVDVSDAPFLLDYLFRGRRPPPEPFRRCAPDPSADRLGCEFHRACRQ